MNCEKKNIKKFLKQSTTTIGRLLYKTYNAKHPECKACNRQYNHDLFAVCCPYHFSLRPCKAMFILQEPPREKEDDCVCCFCHHDQTAFNLRYFIEHHKIDSKQVYITNAALHGSKSEGETHNCSKILEEQINIIKPNIIVVFGGDAHKSLSVALKNKLPQLSSRLRKLKFGDYIKLGSYIIFTTYHPSSRNFNAKKGKDIEKHWEEIAKVLPKKI